MRPAPPIHGIAVVDKDTGWTSHDVVAKARGLLGTRKVGHSGTLDPDATGVLVLGVGRATRLLRFLTVLPKAYEAEIRFGIETDTLDAAGRITVTHEMPAPTPADVSSEAARFVGDLLQVPPMVSAIKVGGRRLHELAREGVEIEREPRPVRVTRFDVAPTSDPFRFTARVECSSGTYVRVLGADLGHALGGGAHLTALRRTAVGAFTLDDARPLEEICLLPIEEAARGLGRTVVDEATAADIAVGKVLDQAELGVAGDPPWPVFGPDGDLLAYYEPHRGGRVKPAVVLIG
ncbi:MAG TPA: tRNA pseudouridine(55) synthase TruB [Microthrixaceae bacterium]|nr:tRNA pseudouridine(55) synthase TruB [Microthrixaceae bacterium]